MDVVMCMVGIKAVSRWIMLLSQINRRGLQDETENKNTAGINLWLDQYDQEEDFHSR